jgi:asparagine synthase (glutamine-hydrolysing)
MANADGSAVIVFNGEIYNFKELRQKLSHYKYRSNSDTEVILAAYQEYGFECVKHFNGMFAFCIYDVKRQILFLARDRCGEKPMYYSIGKNGFIFASELRTILASELFPRKINEDALYKFLKFRYVPGPETIVSGVKKLPPAHYAVYDLKSRQLSISRYWSPLDEPVPELQLRELLKDSVRLRLMSDVPLGVFLSGGIDSSSVVALMRESDPGAKISTFSVGFENWEFNETHHARLVAEYFNTDHREFVVKSDIASELPTIIRFSDELLGDPAIIPVFYLAKEAKRHATVVLTGDGADEAFAGYDQLRFLYYISRMRSIPKPFRAAIPMMAGLVPLSLLNSVYPLSKKTGPQMISRFKKAVLSDSISNTYEAIFCTFVDEEVQKVSKRPFGKSEECSVLDSEYFSSKGDLLSQIQAFDIQRYLPDNLLMKADKMCMAHGVEARAPYIDQRIIGYGLHLPPSAKIGLNSAKRILKSAFKKMLPAPILQRKKQPFQVPIHSWLKGDLAPFVEPRILAGSGFFEVSEIQDICDRLNSSPLYYGRQLWNLMCFNLWYEGVFRK